VNFVGVVEDIGKGVDVAGITIILVGVLASSVQFLRRLRNDVGSAYGLYRWGWGVRFSSDWSFSSQVTLSVPSPPPRHFRASASLGAKS
jgi:hypothetical protein